MDTPEIASTPAPAAPAASSRRSFLLSAGAGLAGATVLGACARNHAQTGESGVVVPTTEVPPTVARKPPTAEDLQNDDEQVRTAASLELMVAAAYKAHGSKLDGALADAATRFAADHDSAAAVFADAVPKGEPTPKANQYLTENIVQPLEDSLVDGPAVADFLSSLESMLTATYINAAGIFTEAEWRQKVMTFGAASARRAALLGNGGQGTVADSGLYPLADLIPNKAFVLSPEQQAAADKAAAAG